jgi:4'-phosphopantetheinyl transferase EntD
MENIMEAKQEHKIFTIAWSFMFLDDIRYDLLFSSLSEQERKVAEKFPGSTRAKEFVAGRHCARQALALYAPGTMLQNITVGVGVWGYPFVESSDVNISIAHTDRCVIAICTNGAFPMGVDIEDHKPSNDVLILSQLSEREKKMLHLFSSDSEGLHILWAAKEAVAKGVRTGFRMSMSFFEVSHVVQKQDGWHIKFDAIGVLSVIAINTKSGVLALALPAGSTIIKGFEAFSTMEDIGTQKNKKYEKEDYS